MLPFFFVRSFVNKKQKSFFAINLKSSRFGAKPLIQRLDMFTNELLSKSIKTLAWLIHVVCIILITIPVDVIAQGDLLITPRRIVFEGNKQIEEITLANTGQESATYSVSFVQYHMTEDGTFEVITEPLPGQMFADPYLRFFPRQVTLAPGESQVVRMQLRRLPNMAEGEYRSHIYFRAIPDEKPLGEDDILSDSTLIGIRLTPIFGITIPAIVRIGNLNATINFSEFTIKNQGDGSSMMSLTFNREGNQSVFGDLNVDYMAPDGQLINVGIVRGIAVYTPNTLRRFSMQLNKPEGVNLTEGKLLVRFSSSNEAKPEVYAEAEYLIN